MARKAAISTEAINLAPPATVVSIKTAISKNRMREMVQFMVEEEQELEKALGFLLFGFESINNHSGFNNGKAIAEVLTYRVLQARMEKIRDGIPHVETLANGPLEGLAEAALEKTASMHEEDD